MRLAHLQLDVQESLLALREKQEFELWKQIELLECQPELQRGEADYIGPTLAMIPNSDSHH